MSQAELSSPTVVPPQCSHLRAGTTIHQVPRPETRQSSLTSFLPSSPNSQDPKTCPPFSHRFLNPSMFLPPLSCPSSGLTVLCLGHCSLFQTDDWTPHPTARAIFPKYMSYLLSLCLKLFNYLPIGNTPRPVTILVMRVRLCYSN